MSGYWATGRARMDRMPTSTISREITHAKTGRSIKKRAMATYPCWPGAGVLAWLPPSGFPWARGCALGAGRSTALIFWPAASWAAFSTTMRSPPSRPCVTIQFGTLQPVGGDGDLLQFAVRPGGQHVRAFGVAQQGVARNQVGVAIDRLLQPHPHVHARQQVAARVLEQRPHGDVVRARIDRQVGKRQRAAARVLGPVGQQQPHPNLVRRHAFQGAGADLLLQLHHLGGGLREVHVDGIDLLHHRQRRGLAFADQRAFRHQRAPRPPVDGRGDAGVVQLQLGALQVGAGQGDLGPGLAFLCHAFGVVAFADGAVRHQVRVAAQLVGGGGQVRLRPRQVGGFGIVGGLQGGGIDLEQGGAARHVLAFLVQARGDDARHAGAHLGLAIGFQPARQFGGDAGGRGRRDDDADLAGASAAGWVSGFEQPATRIDTADRTNVRRGLFASFL